MAKSIGFWALPALIGVIASFRDVPDPELEHIYSVLGLFLSKGQFFLETLPLLSLKLSARATPAALSLIDRAARAGLGILAVCWLCRLRPRHGLLDQGVSCAICLSVFLLLDQGSSKDAISCFSAVAECVVLGVVLCANGAIKHLWLWHCTGVFDALLVIAWLLGCNFFDVAASFCIVFVSNVVNFLAFAKTSIASDVSLASPPLGC